MHGKKIINNSLISVAYKITMLLLGFITRKIFIVYLGKEILGLNSLYANLLDLLNLADLGIGVAVQFQLYEPLVKKDWNKLSRIVTASKKIYNIIGFCIIILGIILTFSIQYFIKETSFPTNYIRIAFFINVMGIALGYFFVHKKLFLQANEKMGIINIIDLSTKLIIVVISLITTVLYKNYLLYLIINALYGLLSNIAVSFIFNKKYPDVKSNSKNTKNEIKELVSNLKDVIPMKLSNYIYNSTDNIIISKVIGLTCVALYSNYMTIINGIMGIEYIIGNVVTSSIGKLMKESKDNEHIFKYFMTFQYLLYIFTSICIVVLVVICNPFIELWLGKDFFLESLPFILLIINFYIHSMYQPAYVFFGASGKFKDDKYITLISAIINIIMSIILVNFIGLAGVIIGTIITDIYIWIVRAYQIVKSHFNQNLFLYWLKMLKYTAITIIGILLAYYLCKYVSIQYLFVDIIVKAIICFIIAFSINIALTINSNEFKVCKNFFLKYKRKDIEQ